MKPVIKTIIPFDGNKDHTIAFSWSGSRAYGHKIVIYDNETNNQVYFKEVTSYALSHTIPAGTLTNGRKYLVQVAIRDYQDVYSELSNKYVFYIFSTPEFEFKNIKENQEFDASSVQAVVNYFQAEFEDIYSYKFYLYDVNNNVLQVSEQMYGRNNLVFTYKGLENNTSYYIQCTGITVNGMPFETTKTKIFIKYENAAVYARFFVESDVKHGGNKWDTNILLIEYSGSETFKYIDDEYVDLNNKTLFYNEGFCLENDGSIFIKGKSLYKNNNHIFSGYNQNSKFQVNLYSYIYDDATLRFKLVVNNALNDYVLYSNPMSFTNDNDIEIRIRKKNNLYKIETYIEGVKVE